MLWDRPINERLARLKRHVALRLLHYQRSNATDVLGILPWLGLGETEGFGAVKPRAGGDLLFGIPDAELQGVVEEFQKKFLGHL